MESSFFEVIKEFNLTHLNVVLGPQKMFSFDFVKGWLLRFVSCGVTCCKHQVMGA
jgi:hypothetical protein